MSVTILLGSRPDDAVVFGLSPLAELTAMLHACADPAHHHAEGLAARAADMASGMMAAGGDDEADAEEAAIGEADVASGRFPGMRGARSG